MAHFRATAIGQRGEASRLGSKSSGMIVNVNGWNVGIRVHAIHNKETGKDELCVWKTGGSNEISGSTLINKVVEE